MLKSFRWRSSRSKIHIGVERLESRQLLANGPLLISEFAAANASILRDSFEQSSDWIELHNPTDAPVSMNGWSLTDDAEDPQKWQLPNAVMEAGEFVIVYASGRDLNASTSQLHTNFRLNADGEYLGLIRPDGSPAHAYSPGFSAQRTDVSFGLLWSDGKPQAEATAFFAEPTPASPNGNGSFGLVSETQWSMSSSMCRLKCRSELQLQTQKIVIQRMVTIQMKQRERFIQRLSRLTKLVASTNYWEITRIWIVD